VISGLGHPPLGPRGLDELARVGGELDPAQWTLAAALVVGLMLWAAGARALSLAFAALGGAGGVAAGFALAGHLPMPDIAGLPGTLVLAAAMATLGVVLAVAAIRVAVAMASGATAAGVVAAAALLAAPYAQHLPDWPAPKATPTHHAQAGHDASDASAGFTDFNLPAADLWTQGHGPTDAIGGDTAQPPSPSTPPPPADATSSTNPLSAAAPADQLAAAWHSLGDHGRQVVVGLVLAAVLLGSTAGAAAPARIATATTALLGAAIWPLAAIILHAQHGTPLATADVPLRAWAAGWIILGVTGAAIQRLVVRRLGGG